uniref:Uncharacterized protein n=1 Tax=Sphaerodactylus townsendi TaxID=933632 RepID=A0ACB8F6B2_9SAUR
MAAKGKCSYPVKHHIHQNLNEEANVEFQAVQSKITPGKRKVSEASMTVPCTIRLPGQSPFHLVNTSTPHKSRIKMPLDMMNSVDQTDASSVPDRRAMNSSVLEDRVSVSSVTKSLQNNNVATEKNAGDKKGGNGKSQYHEDGYGPNFPPLVILPGLENSTAENKSRKKQMCWVPEKIISHCNNQNMSAAETSNLSDRAAKQRAFSSIFKITSPKLRHKQGYNGEIVEQKQNETDKLPGKNGKTNSPESWNDFKHLEDGISKNSSSKIVPSKPQTLLNASRKTKSSVVPSALSIEANGEVDFDACPLRKDVANKKAEQRAKSKAVVETTDMLIHKLSDRYQRSECAKSTRKLYQSFSNSRASLSKSAFSFNKKNSQNKGSKNLKSETLLNITTGHLMDDVYNFNLNGFDEPTIKLGVRLPF